MCELTANKLTSFSKKSIRSIRGSWVCYARGRDFRAGEKIVFWAVLACFCVCIVWRVWFCEKRCFGRLRSCSYSWERIQSSFLKVSLVNALVCMQAKKWRLHAVPSCGSDRLKLHFREGSVADISPVLRPSADEFGDDWTSHGSIPKNCNFNSSEHQNLKSGKL